MGVKKGDKVATILPNCLELLETYWAVAKVGAVVVPLSNLLRGKGLTTLLNDSDTELILTNKTFVEHLDPLRPDLPKMKADRYVLVDDPNVNGYQYYHSLTSSTPAKMSRLTSRSTMTILTILFTAVAQRACPKASCIRTTSAPITARCSRRRIASFPKA